MRKLTEREKLVVLDVILCEINQRIMVKLSLKENAPQALETPHAKKHAIRLAILEDVRDAMLADYPVGVRIELPDDIEFESEELNPKND